MSSFVNPTTIQTSEIFSSSGSNRLRTINNTHSHRLRNKSKGRLKNSSIFILTLSVIQQSNCLSSKTLIRSLSPSKEPTNSSYGFNDPRFIYSPHHRWVLDDHSSNLAYTNYSFANVSTKFHGSGIYVTSSRKADRNILRILIDGSDSYDVNLNGPSMDKGQEEVLWGVQLLEGNHTFLAFNPGSDPTRPYVAFASLTITTGQPKNKEPAVESKPLRVNDESGSSTKRMRMVNRVVAAIFSIFGGILLLVLFIYQRRRRANQKINQFKRSKETQILNQSLASSQAYKNLDPSLTPVLTSYRYDDLSLRANTNYSGSSKRSFVMEHELAPLSILDHQSNYDLEIQSKADSYYYYQHQQHQRGGLDQLEKSQRVSIEEVVVEDGDDDGSGYERRTDGEEDESEFWRTRTTKKDDDDDEVADESKATTECTTLNRTLIRPPEQ
ncbi:expressed protein [Phakopsora pachyrhizi]|uniref:Expressed protein n=1 Tax=Phakopsora pachyrhizi TaxID=170000 RepID=A0AAV0AX17_PHAPC|nr:expressed protein [Phakopsora pachyrhizi]